MNISQIDWCSIEPKDWLTFASIPIPKLGQFICSFTRRLGDMSLFYKNRSSILTDETPNKMKIQQMIHG